VADEGHLSVAPEKTTDFVLSVTRFLGHGTSSMRTVRVRGADPALPIVAPLDDVHDAGCGNDRIWATAKANGFARGLKVASVEGLSGDAHAYDVVHLGRRATVRAGTASQDFAGTEVDGDWVLTTPLLPGERCGTQTLPRNLSVSVTTQCVPGGNP
jgi:hypothetical protein